MKTEVAQMTKPIQQWNQIKLHEDNIFIIKPKYDASNKQIFAKNEYRSNAEQMFFLLDNMGRSEEGLIFKPKYLGDFSQNYSGTVKNLIDEKGEGRHPDYQLMYVDGKINPEL